MRRETEHYIEQLQGGRQLKVTDTQEDFEEFHVIPKYAYGIVWVAVWTEEKGVYKRAAPFMRLSDDQLYAWIATLIDEEYEIEVLNYSFRSAGVDEVTR